MAPTISAIIPVYNTERYLREAVESILSQTFRDFELIVLDDGSTDRSLEILQEIAERDDRVRVLHRENRGIVASVNELIDVARGRYIARMDSDDISRPDRFEKQIAFLDAHPECVAVGSAILLIDPDGSPLSTMMPATTHVDIDSSNLNGLNAMLQPSTMMRKSAALQIQGYQEQYAFSEDSDFFLRLAEVGRLANLPEVLLEYRQHPKSVGYAHRQEQMNSMKKAVEAACARRGLALPPSISNLQVSQPSNADMYRKWAWWALMAGNASTARKYALKTIALQPFDARNFKLAACAVRGH